MPDAPLSRRARRELEARAAERAAAQEDPARTHPQDAATGEIPAVDAGARVVSRRERRRLERLARPMESWTAEEEMIATGQIPAMTPERIAEQERLAREAVEKAAADAKAASWELRHLAQQDLEPQPPVESAGLPAPDAGPEPEPTSAPESRSAPEPVWEPEHETAHETAHEPTSAPSADLTLVQPPARAEADAPIEEREIVEPYVPRFELDNRHMKSVRDESPTVEVPTGFDPDAKIERTPPPTGEPDPDDAGRQPTAWPESFEDILAPPSDDKRPDYAATPAPPAAPPAAPDVPPEAIGTPPAGLADDDARGAETAAARAKVFEELFPLAASQVAATDHDRSEPEDAGSGGSVEPAVSELAQVDDEQAERQRGIEELRRLTEAALSDIERHAQSGGESAQSASAESASPQPHVSPLPDPGALAPPSGESPIVSAPGPADASAGLSSFAGRAPHHATFDESVRTASTEIPVRPMSQAQSTHGQGLSQWDNHPLDAAQESASHDVNDFEPVSNAPRPDLSQFKNWPQTGQVPATTGGTPTTSSHVSTTGALFQPNSDQFAVNSSTTGQIDPLRRIPDLPPVGGAKHFKWHHLAVIGALVFVLGVVIYNVAWGR